MVTLEAVAGTGNTAEAAIQDWSLTTKAATITVAACSIITMVMAMTFMSTLILSIIVTTPVE